MSAVEGGEVEHDELVVVWKGVGWGWQNVSRVRDYQGKKLVVFWKRLLCGNDDDDDEYDYFGVQAGPVCWCLARGVQLRIDDP